MLFDLEDYRTNGITGKDHKPANEVNWVDAYTTARATRDAYLKAVNEYYLSSSAFVSIEEKKALDLDFVAYLDSFRIFNPLMKQFFNGMISLPLVGLNVGDKFDVIEVNKNDNNPNYISYEVPLPSWYSTDNHYVAVLSETGEYTFTEMTQALYDSYKAAMEDFQGKVKNIILTAEGIESFEDYVAPVVPVWNSYPELSGYVRGTNNLTIKDAVVRLVDLDGTNHDIVTDANGYYKFSKEMFYNSIAFDHSATASSVNMFVLSQKVGGAAIYDKTNIFQSSFFGAENSRSLTWEVSIKMGKQARRNFKLDFIPDYSNFPSFSGHVLDQNGNPVQNALVVIKDPSSGASIGSKMVTNPNGGVIYKFDKKYNYFGIERTVLTDINGYYEYPSQMVGEWFNKYGFTNGTDNYVWNISVDALTAPYITWNDNGTDRYSNEFISYLIPYVQNPLTDVIEFEDPAVMIYNQNDWFNNKFQYALNDQNILFFNTIEMGQSYVIDVQEILVDAEYGAEILKLGWYPGYGNIGGLYVSTTTGYATLRFVDGTSQIFGYGDPNSVFGISYDMSRFTNVPTSQYNTKVVFHLYSSEELHGGAQGKIKVINMMGPWDGQCRLWIEDDSLRNHTELERFTHWGGVNNRIDLTGLTSLWDIELKNGWTDLLQIKGLDTLTGLTNIYIEGPMSTNIDRSTTEFAYEPADEYWKKGGNNDYPMLNINDDVQNVIKLGGKYYLIGGNNNISATMQSIGGIGWNSGDFDGHVGYYYSKGMIRINSDMTIDETLDMGTGFTRSNNQWDGGYLNYSAEQNGKILVGGDFNYFRGVSCKKLIRINQDGIKDSSFNFSLDSEQIYKIVVLADNSIIVSGYQIMHGGTAWSLVKLSENGAFVTGISQDNDIMFCFATYTDGRILTVDAGNLVRYNTNGTLDSSFTVETNGIVSYFNGFNNPIAIADDGKFYVSFGGYNNALNDSESPLYHMKLARFNVDGTLDIEYNNNLRKVLETGTQDPWQSSVYMIQLLSNGRMAFKKWGWTYYHTDNEHYTQMPVIDENGNMTQELTLNFGDPYGVLEEEDSVIIFGRTNSDVLYGKGIDRGIGSFAKLNKVGRPYFGFDLPKNNSVMTNDQLDMYSGGSNLNINSATWYADLDIDYSGMSNIQKLSQNSIIRQKAGRTNNISGLTSLTEMWIYSHNKVDIPLITGSTSYSNLEEVHLMDTTLSTLSRIMVGTSSQSIKKLYFTHDSWENGNSFESIGDISMYTSLTDLNISDFNSLTQFVDISANSQLNHIQLSNNAAMSTSDLDIFFDALATNGQENGYISIWTNGGQQQYLSEQAIANRDILANRGWNIYIS